MCFHFAACVECLQDKCNEHGTIYIVMANEKMKNNPIAEKMMPTDGDEKCKK